MSLFCDGRRWSAFITILPEVHVFRTLITAVLVLMGTVGLQAQTADPTVRIPDTQDWGTMRLPKSQYLEAELPIENIATKGMVKIVEIKPGCGCTKTDPDKWELQPGEKATVKIKLNLTPAQSGPISKSVIIRTLHGQDTTTKVVMLKVNLERVLLIGPSSFAAFNDVPVGTKGTSTITITNPTTTPITLTDLTFNNGLGGDVTNGTVVKPNETRTVTLTYTPTSAGQIYGSLQFKATGNGDPEEFIISAYGTSK